jgi:uncharacterized protein (TIGR00661 family)
VSNTPVLNVLVSPLDWGIGHATRCVPVINELLKTGHNVIIASNGRSAEFLKKEFQHLMHINMTSYKISYAKSGKNMIVKMLFQIPYIIYAVFNEHTQLKKIVKQFNIDLIISDNRYGLWHNKTYSVFMTHQLMLKMPKGFSFIEKFIHTIIAFLIKKFDECWIPDFKGNINLSGDLSHKYKISDKHYFIGPLSRFSTVNNQSAFATKKNKILFLLSGPEPQRSIFENIILNQLKNISIKAVVVRGLTESNEEKKLNKNTVLFSHLPTDKIEELINNSEIVVSRSGYSSIMDLLALKARAVLVPTPGQTEQEYLADFHAKNDLFSCIKQDTFDVNFVIASINKPIAEKTAAYPENDLLSFRMNQIIHSILKKPNFVV